MYPELLASGFGVLFLAFCTLGAGRRRRWEEIGRGFPVASTTWHIPRLSNPIQLESHQSLHMIWRDIVSLIRIVRERLPDCLLMRCA